MRGAQQPGGGFQEPGQAGRSRRLLAAALELNPNFADAHNNLGVVFKDQRRLTRPRPATAGHWS